MNSKLFLLFLLVVCIAGFLLAKPQRDSMDCGENEEITNCANTCPPKCEGGYFICSRRCFAGCQCKNGYLLNNERKCVLRKDC